MRKLRQLLHYSFSVRRHLRFVLSVVAFVLRQLRRLRKLLPHNFDAEQHLPFVPLIAAFGLQMTMLIGILPHYAVYSDEGMHAPYVTAGLYGTTPVWLGYAVIALIALVIVLSAVLVNPWAPILVVLFSYVFGHVTSSGSAVGLATHAEHQLYLYGVLFGAGVLLTVLVTKLGIYAQESRERAAQARR